MKTIKVIIILMIIFSFGGMDLYAKKGKAKKHVTRKPASVSQSVDNKKMNYDDFKIEGQSKRSSALYFFERASKDQGSKVNMRTSFKSEILESL
jgi:hypothetical protein